MKKNEIVEALLAAARGVVTARYPEQVEPLWASLEPSLRGAAERMVAQAIEARPMLQWAVDLLPQRRAVAVAAMEKKRELAEKEWSERKGIELAQATEKLNIAVNEYRKGVADLEEELKRGADLPTRPSVEIPLDMLERGGTKMDGFGQEAQIYAKDGKGLMRFRGELRAVPFESDAGRRFEEEATKRARLAEAYLMRGEAYFLLPYEKESVEAAERGEKNAELPAREAKDSAKRRAAKAQPQAQPQPQPQAQPQPQPQPQARDQAADKREKEERKAKAIASATKESMQDPEYLRAFQEAIPSTGPFARDSLVARELYEAASYAKVAHDTAKEAIRHAAVVDYHVQLPIPSAAIRSESTVVDIVRAAKWFADKRTKGAEKRRDDEATRKRAEEKYGAIYTDALENLAAAKKALADRRKLSKKKLHWGLTVKEKSDVEYHERQLGLMESGKYVVPEDALVEARQRLAKERAPAKKA
jgi:hypothetical protein